MNPEDRRLLLAWLTPGETERPPLARLLDELAEKRVPLAPLARYLAIKQREETALAVLAERERWFRYFSWRMVGALFAFGVAGLAFFVAWGGEQAFLGAIFFLAGGASFYLITQAMATWRARQDQKARARIRQRCDQELEALRAELPR